MRRNSLVRRLTIAVLGIELLAALGITSSALWHERDVRLRALDTALKGRSDSLIGAVQDAEDPQDNVRVDPEEFSPGAGDEYAVYNADGRLVGSSTDDLSAVGQDSRDGMRDLRRGKHSYRVLQRQALRIIDRAETGGVGMRRPFTVVYAVRSDHVWHQVLEATRFYLLLSLGVVGLTALLLVLVARRLLKPIQDLAAAATSIEPVTFHFEPPAGAVETDELQPLAEALSKMVTRLKNAFETERRFMNDAAHELKTAVAVVRSSVQVLSMRPRSPEEYRAGLDQVLADNERVEELVRQMLMLASFERRTSAAEAASDLGEEVKAAVLALGSFAELRGVSVRCTSQPEATVPLASEAARALASNLVLNSLQHSRPGTEVIVRVEKVESANSAVRLTVQDFGSGIAPENRQRVFERFFREDPSRSRQTGGTGLGLSICKSIVDGAGGTIEIDSRQGEGTIVRVELPSSRAAHE